MDLQAPTEKTTLLLASQQNHGKEFLKPSDQRFFSQSEEDAIYLHTIFGAIAFTTLLAVPTEHLGLSLWVLVFVWYVAIFVVAHRKKHSEWMQMMRFIIPLCICFIFPDGFLVEYLHTIVFPDMGVWTIYGVPSFMPFMWAIPIFLSILFGRGLEERGVGIVNTSLGAGGVAFVIFAGSEEILTQIPIWSAVETVTKIGNMAVYVLVPEFCLGVTASLMYRFSRHFSLLVQIFAAFLTMCVYLGNLIVWNMIIEGPSKL